MNRDHIILIGGRRILPEPEGGWQQYCYRQPSTLQTLRRLARVRRQQRRLFSPSPTESASNADQAVRDCRPGSAPVAASTRVGSATPSTPRVSRGSPGAATRTTDTYGLDESGR